MKSVPPGLARRIERRRRLLEWLCRWLARAREALGRVSLVLFGSYARGDFNVWSDVDLILVWEGFEGVRYLDRWLMVKDLVEDAEESLDLVLWSPREAEIMIGKPSWRKALEACIVLADDYGVFGGLGCERHECPG